MNSNRKLTRQITLALVLGVFAATLFACDNGINITGVEGLDNFTNQTNDSDKVPSVNITPVEAEEFNLSSTYLLESGGYKVAKIKAEKNRVAVSSRTIPLTFLPIESNTVNVTVLSGANESTYLKGSIVNRKVEFEFVSGVAPEGDLLLMLESPDLTDFIPLEVTSYKDWVKVRSLSLIDSFGDDVGSRTENTATFHTVDVASGDDFENVAPNGRFQIDFGSGDAPSNPDVYIENSNPEFYSTRLVEDVSGNFFLDVLPTADDVSAVIRVTSVEDASFTSVIKVAPSLSSIRSFAFAPVSLFDNDTTLTYKFSISKLPEGSAVVLIRGSQSKVFASVGKAVEVAAGQTTVLLEATTKSVLTDGDEEVLTAKVFTDKTLKKELRDIDGNAIETTIKVVAKATPRIQLLTDTTVLSTAANTDQVYEFSVLNFPDGAVVKLVQGDTPEVFASVGPEAAILTGKDTLKLTAKTKATLAPGSSETLTAIAYTDNGLKVELKDINNQTVSATVKVNVVLPPGTIDNLADTVVYSGAAGQEQTYSFNIGYLPAGSFVKLSQESNPKVFASVGSGVTTALGQTKVGLRATSKATLKDGDTETLTATVYTDSSMAEVMKGADGSNLVATVNVVVQTDPVIQDHANVQILTNQTGTKLDYTFSVTGLPVGAVVQLTQGTGAKVFASMGSNAVIAKKGVTSVVLSATTKAALADGDTETLTATVYTDATLSQVLEDSAGNRLVATVNVLVALAKWIHDAPDAVVVSSWAGRGVSYTFETENIPVGAVVKLERGSHVGNTVFTGLGSFETIKKGQTEVTLIPATKSSLNVGDSETLIAKVYTNAAMVVEALDADGKPLEAKVVVDVLKTPRISAENRSISKYVRSSVVAKFTKIDYVSSKYDLVAKIISATGDSQANVNQITAKLYYYATLSPSGDIADRVRVRVQDKKLTVGNVYIIRVYIVPNGTTDVSNPDNIYSYEDIKITAK